MVRIDYKRLNCSNWDQPTISSDRYRAICLVCHVCTETTCWQFQVDNLREYFAIDPANSTFISCEPIKIKDRSM